jgi:hypothetical protein
MRAETLLNGIAPRPDALSFQMVIEQHGVHEFLRRV